MSFSFFVLILVLVKDNKSALSSENKPQTKCITYYNEIIYVHILYRFLFLQFCAHACFKHL